MSYNLELMEDLDKKQLIKKLYQTEQKSWDAIAKECKCSRTKIRTLARKFGIAGRSRTDAQHIVLKVHGHPRQGATTSIATKTKISESMGEHWDQLSEKEQEKKRQVSKDLWKNRDPEENKRIQTAGAMSFHKASRDGSKLERYLAFELNKLGYKVELHKEHHLKNEALQIDIFLPTIGVAIEVDGPTHFEPIFGQDKLEKIQKSDRQKTGLILSCGYYFIRIKHVKKLSHRFQRDTLNKIVKILHMIKSGNKQNIKLFEV